MQLSQSVANEPNAYGPALTIKVRNPQRMFTDLLADIYLLVMYASSAA